MKFSTMPDQPSPQTSQTSPAHAPPSQGSYAKGIATSLVFQLIVFITGAVVFGWDEIHPGAAERSVNRRRAIGYMMMLLWGLIQWALVLPMVRKWSGRGQTRSVKGICVTSILGAIPSSLAVVAVLFEVVAVTYEKLQRWIAK